MKSCQLAGPKNAFGSMIDTALAEPVLIEKHKRGVAMVISVAEYEGLNGASNAASALSDGTAIERGTARERTEQA